MVLLLALLAGCNKQAATTGQTATLALKDGSTVTGTVTKSDTSSITIQTPTGVVSTYPVSQISSVSYVPGPATASSPAPGQVAPAPQDSSAPATPAPDGSNTAPTAAAPSSGQPAAEQPPAQEYQPAETFLTIPAGTTLAIRTGQSIDARSAAPGQTYPAIVARDVFDSNGQVAIPRGSDATLVVRESREQGRVEGRSELALDVAAVRVAGRRYRLETGDFVEKGRQGLGKNKRTAEFAGGGSLLGGIIGAVAGGGRGAAIGILSGAAGGAAAQTATRGKDVRIPAETVLNFHSRPLSVFAKCVERTATEREVAVWLQIVPVKARLGMSMAFLDRRDAGRELARELKRYAGDPSILVLALPRGGVPVAYEVARALQAPLDVFVVRKLGVPGHRELAMGAIASGGLRVLNPDVIDALGITPGMIEAVAAKELVELERQQRAYRGDAPFPELAGRTVIVVDDGLATGSTMRAAVRALRQSNPRRIIVAVPVAAQETARSLRQEAEVVCPSTPPDFHAVSMWYEDFSQTSDEEVRNLLESASHLTFSH